jgi:hypothetical protein
METMVVSRQEAKMTMSILETPQAKSTNYVCRAKARRTFDRRPESGMCEQPGCSKVADFVGFALGCELIHPWAMANCPLTNFFSNGSTSRYA